MGTLGIEEMNGNLKASNFSYAVAVTLLVTAVSGGMYIGALANDVETLKREQADAEDDHDRLISMETEQRTMKDDITEVKTDVKLILAAINKLEAKDDDG